MEQNCTNQPANSQALRETAINRFSAQESLFKANLPDRPYCSKQKPIRLQITSIKRALKYPYIQLNEPWRRVWLVMDIDREGGAFAWEDANVAPPTFTAVNKQNAHAHSGWLLQCPVLMGDHDRAAPMRYLEAIEGCMTEKLQADPGYAGLIAKNPLNATWHTLYGEQRPYTLEWISEYLPGIEKWKRPDTAPLAGVGRNVDTFDSVRIWSYKHVLDRKRDGVTITAWIAELVDRCVMYTNTAHAASPLSMAECRHIAKSIAKWTYRVFSLERFAQIQSERGHSGNIKRWGDPTERNAAIIALASDGFSYRQIASRVGCHYSTVSRIRKDRFSRIMQDSLDNYRRSAFSRLVDSEATRKPWEEEGISRATWYRRKARKVDQTGPKGGTE